MAGVEGERLLAVARGDDREALLLEVEPDEVHDVALVVDDEDGLHRQLCVMVGREYADETGARGANVSGE